MRTFSILVEDLQQLDDKLTSYRWRDDKRYLVQLFSTQSKSLVEAYAHNIVDALPQATLLGHSTRSLIFGNQIETQGSLIVVAEFETTDCSSALVPYSGAPDLDGFDLKQKLKIAPNAQAVISFSVKQGRRDYPLYRAFLPNDDCPPIAGGLAQATAHDDPWVLHHTQVHHNAAVAAVLHSDALKVWTNAYSEWNPVGMEHTVEEAQGNRLIRLGNKTAYEMYKHYLADGGELTINQLINFPLHRDVGGQEEVCSVIEILPDGSMLFNKPWQKGDQVRFCYNHPSLTLEQVKHGVVELAMHQPESIYIYNCASRLDFMDGAEEVQAFGDIAITNGSYCMGELFGDGVNQEVLHHSLTYLAMRESDEVQSFNLPKDDVASNNISPLFSLIRNAINDLDYMNGQMEYQLERHARKLQESYRRDARTGLRNRVALQEHLNQIRDDEHLVTLKLLNFSQINDKYGYPVGDQLLKDLSLSFTNRIRKRLGTSAELNLYSIGVGEWAFVFRANQSSEAIQAQFARFADMVEQTNFEPRGLNNVDYLSVSLCGGLASRRDFPDASGDELLLKAIEARRSGVRNNTHICNALDIQVKEEVRKEQLGWLTCVSRAILQQNIITYSQPIYHAVSHKVFSYECLVRIEESDGRIISPGQFLPIISDTHLYTRLSRHMIESTLNFMAHKPQAFSINLSPQDLMSDKTLLLLEDSIAKLGDPTRLGLEVLESEQIRDYGRMIEVCSHFRSLGARIIVDDFGSGYSNIDEILKLEPEVIKLDGSLIRNIHQDERQRRIASQLIRLCQVFNAKTVAEFVHNQQVCRIAEDMGVDYLQGFYLGEPRRLF